jgi:hypothetical protein
MVFCHHRKSTGATPAQITRSSATDHGDAAAGRPDDGEE